MLERIPAWIAAFTVVGCSEPAPPTPPENGASDVVEPEQRHPARRMPAEEFWTEVPGRLPPDFCAFPLPETLDALDAR